MDKPSVLWPGICLALCGALLLGTGALRADPYIYVKTAKSPSPAPGDLPNWLDYFINGDENAPHALAYGMKSVSDQGPQGNKGWEGAYVLSQVYYRNGANADDGLGFAYTFYIPDIYSGETLHFAQFKASDWLGTTLWNSSTTAGWFWTNEPSDPMIAAIRTSSSSISTAMAYNVAKAGGDDPKDYNGDGLYTGWDTGIPRKVTIAEDDDNNALDPIFLWGSASDGQEGTELKIGNHSATIYFDMPGVKSFKVGVVELHDGTPPETNMSVLVAPVPGAALLCMMGLGAVAAVRKLRRRAAAS